MDGTTRRIRYGSAARALARAVRAGFVVLGVAFVVASRPVVAQDVDAVRVLPAEVSAERLAELDRGKVSVHSSRAPEGNRFVLEAVLKTTPERVFAVVRDFEAAKEWMPNQTEATVLERRGTRVRGRVGMHGPGPLKDRHFELVMDCHEEAIGGVASFVCRFQNVHGVGNLDDTHGYWLLQPHPSHDGWTLVTYVVNADIGAPLPRFVIRWGANDVLRASIYNLRERLGLPRDED